MLDSKLLADLLRELGQSATPVVQIGASTDRYNITGVQFEHYQNDHDFLVLIAGSNNLQDRDTSEDPIFVSEERSVPSVKREYLLQALVYEAANRYTKKELVNARAGGYGPAAFMFENLRDEYPEAELTEGETEEVFLAAARTFPEDKKEGQPKASPKILDNLDNLDN